MSLLGAGVTRSLIAEAFAGLNRADKMSVARAIERLAKRFNEPNADRQLVASLALRVMAEAHQDFTLAWAGGAVTYFCDLAKVGSLTCLARAARDRRNDPATAPFLDALRDTLCSPDKDRGKAALLIHESYMALCEMKGSPVDEAFMRLRHSRYMHDLIEHHPDVYTRDYGHLESA
jgi:hypothetical protein